MGDERAGHSIAPSRLYPKHKKITSAGTLHRREALGAR